jgi:hypothetical protein
MTGEVNPWHQTQVLEFSVDVIGAANHSGLRMMVLANFSANVAYVCGFAQSGLIAYCVIAEGILPGLLLQLHSDATAGFSLLRCRCV